MPTKHLLKLMILIYVITVIFKTTQNHFWIFLFFPQTFWYFDMKNDRTLSITHTKFYEWNMFHLEY